MEALFQSIVDCINSTEVNLGNATYRLVVAMILGTLVGAERRCISDLKTAIRAESPRR